MDEMFFNVLDIGKYFGLTNIYCKYYIIIILFKEINTLIQK